MSQMAANGLCWLLNQCFDMSLEVHHDFAINVIWHALVVDCAH